MAATPDQDSAARAARATAEAIVNAVRQPLVMLGADFRVASANDAFLRTFRLDRAASRGAVVFELGGGEWDMPEMRRIVEEARNGEGRIAEGHVEHAFETLGRRVLLVSARRLDPLQLVLLAVEDVTAQRESRAVLEEGEARFRALVEAAAEAVWEADPRGMVRTALPDGWSETARPEKDVPRGAFRLDEIHPDDRREGERQWREAVAAEATFDAELRLRAPDGSFRWTNLRAAPLRDARGRVVKWVGMNLDVDDRRRAEEERELLLAELNHRVKNLLGVIRSLANQSVAGRSADEYRRVLVGRIDALARAHSLALAGEWRAVDLGELARRALEPYIRGDRSEAVTIAGPPVALAPRATMTLGLVLHELATNAMKYGALSDTGGRVTLTWRREEGVDGAVRVRLAWEEAGGPPVTPPRQPSFGTRMIERVFGHELKGGAVLAYRPEGVRLEAWFSPA